VAGLPTGLDTTLSAATGERGVDPLGATVAPVLTPTSPPGGLTYAPTAPVPAPPPSALRRVLLGVGAVVVILGLVGLGLFLGGRRQSSPRPPAPAPAPAGAKAPPTLVLGITEYAKRDVLDREWNPILESVNRHLAGQAVVKPEYIAYGDIVEATLEGRVDVVVLSEFVYVTSQNRLAREKTREFTFLGTKTQNFQNYYRTMIWLRPGHPQAAPVKAPLTREQAGRLAIALGDEKSTSKSAVPRIMIRTWGLRESDFATVTRGLRSHQIAQALAQGTADLGPLNLVDLDGLRRDGKPATGLVEVARSLPIPYDAWVASQAQLRRKLGEPFAAKLEALRSAIGQSRAAILHSDFESTYHAFRLYLGGAFLDPPRPGEPPGDGIRADLAPFDHEILVLRGLTAGTAVDLATFHEDEDRRIMEGYRRIYCRVIGTATVLTSAGTGLRVRPAGAVLAGGWAGVRVLPKGECTRSSP
jgi:ABC-type phosphate/phosphonate transport system substrate-binding protein